MRTKFIFHTSLSVLTNEEKSDLARNICTLLCYYPTFIYSCSRFAYGLGFPTGYLVGSIQKLDVELKRITASWEDPKCRATEPQFVPRPGGSDEEDGVVVFACLGTRPDQPSTHLIVLEPLHLRELGRFSVPHTTPVGFHGIWV